MITTTVPTPGRLCTPQQPVYHFLILLKDIHRRGTESAFLPVALFDTAELANGVATDWFNAWVESERTNVIRDGPVAVESTIVYRQDRGVRLLARRSDEKSAVLVEVVAVPKHVAGAVPEPAQGGLGDFL